MHIGEISRSSGVSRDTIRFYEKLGLIAAESRDVESNYKRYGSQTIDRLMQIQQLKEAGFTLNEIQALLCIDDEHNRCKDLPAKLNQKIDKIDEQIAALKKFKASLIEIRRACDGRCGTLSGLPTCMPPKADSAPNKCC